MLGDAEIFLLSLGKIGIKTGTPGLETGMDGKPCAVESRRWVASFRTAERILSEKKVEGILERAYFFSGSLLVLLSGMLLLLRSAEAWVELLHELAPPLELGRDYESQQEEGEHHGPRHFCEQLAFTESGKI